MSDSQVGQKLCDITWGSPIDENQTKPYGIIEIISDVPDPIQTQVRIMIRIVWHNESVTPWDLQGIEKEVKRVMLENLKFGDFYFFNIVAGEGTISETDKRRKEYLRDYLLYFVN